MIRCLLAIILVGFTTQLTFSQTKIIHGTVVDKSSREPIPYVHVFSTLHSSGTISDLNGDFTLVVHSNNNDSLRFSSIGYRTQKLAIRNFFDKRFILELEEDRVLLPGFTVHALSAKELVQKSISKIPVNYIQSENESKAFYWNSVSHDDVYTDFYEGYLTLLRNGKISYDSTVSNIKNPGERIMLFDSLQDVLHFDVINKTSMFVNPANINDWKFNYVYSSEHDAESFIIIEATMFNNPFNKSEEFSTLKLYMHSKSLAIVRIDFTYRWTNGKRYNWKDDVQFTLSRLDGTVEYAKNQNQQYDFSYLFIRSEFSFMKKYNPAIFKIAVINHELVKLKYKQMSNEKPVVRWGDYLDATNLLLKEHTIKQD